MITVQRLNGAEVTINAALIESIEAGPDTVIVLATGNRYVVRDTVEEVVAKVVAYQRLLHAGKAPPNPIEGFVKK